MIYYLIGVEYLMKFKVSLIFTCLIIFLFCISSVSAEDNLTDEIGTANNDTISIESNLNTDENLQSSAEIEDTLSIDENEEKLTAGNTWYVDASSSGGDGKSPRSAFQVLFLALSSCSDGDTIMIAPGRYSGILNTGFGITQNNLKIQKYGDGEAIFDGGGEKAIWVIGSQTINIQGLTFENAYTDGRGAALIFSENLVNSVINATFRNNRAGDGAAICFHGTVTDVTIAGNFIGNEVTYYGGAIYFMDELRNVNVIGNFANNKAGNGGAIFFIPKMNNVNINGNFTSNSAQQGGALFFASEINYVNIGGNFISNQATHRGGAMHFSKELHHVNITADFDSNRAYGDGIWGLGGANSFNNPLTDVNIVGKYTNNQANSHGGANAFYEKLVRVNISGIFENNKANNGYVGGANYFFYSGSDLNINGNFTNNQAESGAANFFAMSYSNIKISGNFTGNKATYLGGANYFDALTNSNIGGNYVNNKANSGGANYFSALTNSVVGGNYVNNAADAGGANYFNSFTNSYVSGNFTDNTANDGGALCFNGYGKIMNSNFTHNIANSDKGGGAIRFYGDGIVENSAFTDNNAANGGSGGAIKFSALGTVTKSNFTGNRGRYGGAVRFAQTGSSMTDCILTDNLASMNGGAVQTIAGCTIKDSVFIKNTAKSGGAIYSEGNNQIPIQYCNFINNSASCVVYIKGCELDSKINDCIFINNDKNIISGNNITAKDSWFGNNATNYNIKPEAGNVKLENWLFLNATANPNTLTLYSSTDIVFKLYSYNQDSGVGNYNNALLKPIKLTVTSNNQVNTALIDLEDTVKFTATHGETGWACAKIENAWHTITFDIPKISPDLSVESQIVSYSGNIIISVSYNSNATGKLNITLKGKKFSQTSLMELNKTISLENILPDEYNVTIIFLGDDSFLSTTGYATLTINKLTTNIICEPIITHYDDEEYLIVTLKDENNKTISGVNLTVELNGIENYTTDENGTIKVSTKGIPVNNYTAKITFNGDDIYVKSNASAKVTINKVNSTLTVDDISFDYNSTGSAPLSFDGAEGVTANVTDHEEAIVNVEDNVITVSNLNAGNYTLIITTIPDENHYSVTKTINVTVNKIDTILILDNVEVDYGSSVNVTATTEGTTGITAKIDENSISIDNYTIPISGLNAGTYNLTVTTIPDKNHNAVNKTVKLTVKKIDSILTIINTVEIDYGSSVNVTATTEGTTGITAKIDENSISIDNYTIPISGLNAGTYNLTVTTIPDKNHNAVNKTVKITVKKIKSIIYVNDTALDYGTTTLLNVVTEGADGITAKINGRDARIISNQILIPPQNAGTYTMSVTTIPDGNHIAVTKNVKITINKVNSTLSVDNIIFDYEDSGSITVSYTGSNGITAKVIDHTEANITINNKQITISNLNAGNYTLKVTTIPDNNHKPVTKTANITVNKINSTITIPETIFDYQESINANAITTGAANITAKIDGLNMETKENIILIHGIDVGNHTLSVTTIPDDNHIAVTKNVEITINKVNSTLSVNDMIFDYGNPCSGTISFTGATGVTAEVIDHKEADITIENNIITVSKLDIGNYTLKVTTVSDSNHYAVTKTATITINKVRTVLDADEISTTCVAYNDVVIILKDINGNLLSGFNVTVDLNGAENYTADENGAIRISTRGLSVGIHEVSVSFEGNINYFNCSNKTYITITKEPVEIKSSPLTKIYNQNGYITLSVKDSQGNPLADTGITLVINSIKYTCFTDRNGNGKLNINLKPKTYVATITFAGNDKYETASVKENVIIKKMTPKLTAKKKTFKKAKKIKKYTVTLKDNRGKAIKKVKLTMKVKGKTYKAKTNTKGKAVFKIKKLIKKGNFKATVTYKGNEYYNKVIKKVKIKIK